VFRGKLLGNLSTRENDVKSRGLGSEAAFMIDENDQVDTQYEA